MPQKLTLDRNNRACSEVSNLIGINSHSLALLQVYDGANATAPELFRTTGTILPAILESSGSALLIRMTTNSIINDAGFKAAFSSGKVQVTFLQQSYSYSITRAVIPGDN